MMTIVRAVVVGLLVLCVSASALAGDLRSAAKAAADDEQPKTKKEQLQGGPSKNGLFWAGTGLFVAGMGVGIYGFINNKNGKYSEFGEANSTNKSLGTTGLAVAFGGGALMFLGAHRAKFAPSISAGPRGVKVSKQLSW